MNLEFGYLLLTHLVLGFIILIGIKAINATSKHATRDKIILIAGLVIWQLYIYGLTKTGVLATHSFPPLFALAFIIPSFIFTGVFLFLNRKKQWIHAIPQQWIVYFQSFRVLVEILFVLTVARGIINPEVTIEGYNFDMIFAATAPLVAFLAYGKKMLSKKIVLIWNYLGIAVLASVIFLFLTCIYKPELYGEVEPLLPLSAFGYPYVLIAGFLMPVAVFLHVLSIVQINNTIRDDII